MNENKKNQNKFINKDMAIKQTKNDSVDSLVGYIKGNIYNNNSGEISGDRLQDVLLEMTDVLSNLAPDTPVEPGANYIAGDNIKIEDNTISAVGYRYDEEKNSVSIGGGETVVTVENDGVSEDIVIEGKTQAVGKNSFASGFNSIAYGEGSHAEGIGTFAIGKGSHAEGFGIIAQGEYQHAQGKYNIIDTENIYAHILGNGSANDERSNAHTIDWDGNAWFAGGIELTSPNGTRYRFTVSDDGILNVTRVEPS